jgi:FAD/FMN-containing dehydrogenase
MGVQSLRQGIISPETVKNFARSISGAVLLPGDSAYDRARHVFNTMIDRRPALIVRPAGPDDIRRAVVFAHEHDLPLSIKGGGHNVAGSAVCDGGVMVDCSAMRGVLVDAQNRTALAEPGALLRDVDQATQQYGLATPFGVVSVTGIAGLTLGGGIGWLNGKHGLSCDNLIAADVVTADGQLLSVSAEENADLFWAIRGGSGNFGLVTSLSYQLHPVGPVLAGSLAFPASRTRDVLRAYDEFAANCPDELSLASGIGLDADGQPTFGLTACWSGELKDGDRALAPLRALGPTVDTVAPMDFVALQTSKDAGYPTGRHHYWKSRYLTSLPDEAIDILCHFAQTRPSAASAISFQHLHGVAARVDPTATAFPHRRTQHELLFLGQWLDPADTERNLAWTREAFEAMKPFAVPGVYVNDLGDEGTDRIREAFGLNYDRLVTIKNRYDPTNLFRSNQNIAPMV